MSIIKNFSLVLWGLCLINPAYATNPLCVKLSPDIPCELNSADTQAGWETICKGTPVNGLAFCTAEPGSAGAVKSYLSTLGTTVDKNVYCWCKMVRPFMSQWIFAYGDRDPSSCLQQCAFACMENLYEKSSGLIFRTAMFNNMF